jgi:hypothetical protein
VYLCVLTRVCLRRWGLKEGSRFKTWKRRFFVLREVTDRESMAGCTHLLVYFKTQKHVLNGWGFTLPHTAIMVVYDVQCQLYAAMPSYISLLTIFSSHTFVFITLLIYTVSMLVSAFIVCFKRSLVIMPHVFLSALSYHRPPSSSFDGHGPGPPRAMLS